MLPLNFAFLGPVACNETGNCINSCKSTIFAPIIFAFTYLPAKIVKIKGAQKFRGLQYWHQRPRVKFNRQR